MTIFWLAAFIVFAIGEAVTVGLVSVWFAVGALAAMFATASGCRSRCFWGCPPWRWPCSSR